MLSMCWLQTVKHVKSWQDYASLSLNFRLAVARTVKVMTRTYVFDEQSHLCATFLCVFEDAS
jgi:hypothetical protein